MLQFVIYVPHILGGNEGDNQEQGQWREHGNGNGGCVCVRAGAAVNFWPGHMAVVAHVQSPRAVARKLFIEHGPVERLPAVQARPCSHHSK